MGNTRPSRFSVVPAAGGTGKSTLAAGLSGELEQRGIPTLILDWETSEDDYRATAARIFGDDPRDRSFVMVPGTDGVKRWARVERRLHRDLRPSLGIRCK